MSTGHIRRRGKRSWELKYDVGTDVLTGKRRIRYLNVKGTKKEAELELAKLIASAGDTVDPTRETVAEFMARWERDWAANALSPKTAERYGDLIRTHIVPRIGALPVQKLRTAHLAEMYATLLRERSLAARTVGHIHRLLHRALGHAVRWGVIATNPVTAAEPPKVPETEIEILTEDQVRDVIGKLRGRALFPIVALALATGMRRGELLALRWRDVDVDAGKIQVERSLEQTRAGLRFKGPKTRHGRRNIALPAYIVTELRAHRRGQQEQRLALGLGKDEPDALVFRRLDGSPLIPNSVTTEWRRNVRVLKLPPVTFHALRHTHASQLIASGLDVLTIARRIGHASPAITLKVYGHLFSATDDRAAAVFETAYGSTFRE